ncbi:phosphotransferase family protein [Streptomyces sp. 4503]|uniref:Phosphotransferase family protein n=1 Tax=Streptomyces niphimycinicus TaxID=2842201 RepID=A0ABS6CCJ4_9ACTN|nr:phosphotransferase family protein [Streptomyces niphimycinicus]MBU3864624.1 phosphotransferase family protein [Streptomyces niphimycinicus]
MSMATQVPELAARVRDRLARHHPGAPVGELTVLPGGHSGLTYEVAAGDARYVVKAVPPGQRPVGRNDVLRQSRVLGALAGSMVPVPGVVAVDETQPAWFAMDFAAGEAIEPVLDDHEVDPATARARMLEIASVLRRLHGTDVHTPGLDAPAPLDAAGELERWSRTLRAVPVELRPDGEELLARLADGVPHGLPPVLLHGDFRLGNVLCVGERAVAVVDWEIWSVGDPRIDLGWFLLFADHRNFPQLGHAVPGLPGEAELLDTYLDGRPALPAMDWFRALGRMKMAAIMGHNLRRHREGKHHDPDQERLPPTIAAMIRTARDILG